MSIIKGCKDLISYRLTDGSVIGEPIDKLCPKCSEKYIGYSYSKQCGICYDIEYTKLNREYELRIEELRALPKKYSRKIGEIINDENFGKLVVAEAEYYCNGCIVHEYDIKKNKEMYLDISPKICLKEKCENIIFKRVDNEQ